MILGETLAPFSCWGGAWGLVELFGDRWMAGFARS